MFLNLSGNELEQFSPFHSLFLASTNCFHWFSSVTKKSFNCGIVSLQKIEKTGHTCYMVCSWEDLQVNLQINLHFIIHSIYRH